MTVPFPSCGACISDGRRILIVLMAALALGLLLTEVSEAQRIPSRVDALQNVGPQAPARVAPTPPQAPPQKVIIQETPVFMDQEGVRKSLDARRAAQENLDQRLKKLESRLENLERLMTAVAQKLGIQEQRPKQKGN